MIYNSNLKSAISKIKKYEMESTRILKFTIISGIQVTIFFLLYKKRLL